MLSSASVLSLVEDESGEVESGTVPSLGVVESGTCRAGWSASGVARGVGVLAF